jgi:hypothetical protein
MSDRECSWNAVCLRACAWGPTATRDSRQGRDNSRLSVNCDDIGFYAAIGVRIRARGRSLRQIARNHRISRHGLPVLAEPNSTRRKPPKTTPPEPAILLGSKRQPGVFCGAGKESFQTSVRLRLFAATKQFQGITLQFFRSLLPLRGCSRCDGNSLRERWFSVRQLCRGEWRISFPRETSNDNYTAVLQQSC